MIDDGGELALPLGAGMMGLIAVVIAIGIVAAAVLAAKLFVG